MVHIFSTFAFLALTLLTIQVAAQDSNNDPNGKPFYLSAPSCDSYQCHVTKHTGDKLKINWLNRLSGMVNIHFVPEKSDGTTYTIAHHLAADNNKDSCNKGSQKTCGSYTWLIPKNVKSGDYSVDLHSLHGDKKIHSYTDIVTIKKRD